MHRYNLAGTLREEFHEADFGASELIRWVGGALVAAALVAVVLTAVHRAGYGLLIALMFGVVLLVMGAMLLVVDRRAAQVRALGQAVIGDLHTAAEIIRRESETIREMTQDPRRDLTYEIPLHIEWFVDYTESLTETLVDAGLADEQAEQLRATRDDGGEVVPPAALPYGRLGSATDLVNVLAQYEDVLLTLAGGRALPA